MADFKNAILRALENRGEGKTICPSEVLTGADKKDPHLMQQVREAAHSLIADGIVVATAKGKEIEILSHRGPIRLGKARGFDQS